MDTNRAATDPNNRGGAGRDTRAALDRASIGRRLDGKDHRACGVRHRAGRPAKRRQTRSGDDGLLRFAAEDAVVLLEIVHAAVGFHTLESQLASNETGGCGALSVADCAELVAKPAETSGPAAWPLSNRKGSLFIGAARCALQLVVCLQNNKLVLR